jgi:hypothetical protein
MVRVRDQTRARPADKQQVANYYRPIKAPNAISKRQRHFHRGEPCCVNRYWLILLMYSAGVTVQAIADHPQVLVENKKRTTTIGGCLRERSSSVACHYLCLYQQ